MLEAIRNRSFARVADLSAQFGISEVTVRSDLDALERDGSVRRVHGGAILEGRRVGVERSFEEEAGTAAEEKAAIAAIAAAMVGSGDTIILDVGTTCSAVAAALVARTDLQSVVVITNGLNIALVFEASMPRFTVVVTGGTVRPLQHSLVDPLAGLMLEHLNADLMFLGCNGVDAERGVTNVNLPEATMKRRMMGSASRTIAVADGSKIGHVSAARVCGVEELALLITGPSAPSDALSALEREGLEIRSAT
jgi:DeoR family transcriptional regulator, aga operon transcriptional repressor